MESNFNPITDVNYSNIPFDFSNKLAKTPLSKALQEGKLTMALKMIKSSEEKGLPFNEQELWQIKVIKNLDFSNEDFLSLSPAMKNLIYRTANNCHNISFVSRLNSLGMNAPSTHIKSPGILSEFMDVVTIDQIILNLLKKFRHDGILLTGKELEKQEGSWMKKWNFSRILGGNHLSQLIEKLELKYIKVPEKKIVIESPNRDTLSFSVRNFGNDLIDINCDDINVYAEKITSVKRFITLEEINELFTIIKASDYIDLYDANFVVGKDGIYFIDTEFKSFSGEIEWSKMSRLRSFISPEHQDLFVKLINEQIENQTKTETQYHYSFDDAKMVLKILKKLPSDQVNKEIAELKYIIRHQKMVGSNLTRTFSFSIKDILSN